MGGFGRPPVLDVLRGFKEVKQTNGRNAQVLKRQPPSDPPDGSEYYIPIRNMMNTAPALTAACCSGNVRPTLLPV